VPNLTIRNVNKDVHRLLLASAKVHNRSLNQEIISILTFEADLANRGLELIRTYPRARRTGGNDGAGGLGGPGQLAAGSRAGGRRR